MKEVIEKFFETLRKTQFMPSGAMVAYQRSLLEKIIRHAREHVPFYRDSGRLAPLFRMDDTIAWERWAEIPLLTRKELQTAGDRLKSEYVPSEHGRIVPGSTSGSTGEPLKVLQTELAVRWASSAVRLRDLERHKIDPTQRLAYVCAPADFDITTVRRYPSWSPEFESLGLAGERVDVTNTRPAAELVEVVASLQPTYLHISPTPLQLMVAHDSRRRLANLGLAAVFSYAEHLPSESKTQMECHLGCKIIDFYGSIECGHTASTCPYCGSFHFHAEIALIEAIDEKGSRVPPGETGRIVVTPLYNYAMPLIRYDHNDFARRGFDGCRITLPAFDAIFGKRRVPFIFSGRQVLTPLLPTNAVIDFLGAQAFQVAQTGPDHCEFRIVPGLLSPSQMRFGEMTKLIHMLWWDGLLINYRILDAMPCRTPQAKFQTYVQEFLKPTEYANN